MYAPATPATPAPILAPAEFASTSLKLAAPALGRPVASGLHVRRSPERAGRRSRDRTDRAPGPARVVGDAPGTWTSRLEHDCAHTHRRQGSLQLRYLTRRTGSQQVRMRFAGSGDGRASHRRLGRLNVFRTAGASWYGGGGGLACGGQLTSSTMGVANKTLPCGTLVTLRYAGPLRACGRNRPRPVCGRA